MTTPSSALTPIQDMGVLHCSGPDTLSFLQGQLSNDFALLDQQHARLCAYLTPKGRMQASFIAVRLGPEDVLLITHRSVLPAVQKRLSMFVLRAKTKLNDASEQWQLHGLLGNAAITALGGATEPWHVHRHNKTDTGNTTAVQASTQASAPQEQCTIALYPANGLPRALHISPKQAELPFSSTELPSTVWEWTEIAAGIAHISAPVVDLFVPQMLNYESVGGISFKKGCYPGQEIVARSQFRGAIKRRAYLATGVSDTLPALGSEIFAARDTEQPCGVVVQAAWQWPEGDATDQRSFAAIVSLKTELANEPLLLPSAAENPASSTALKVSAMPYPLKDDI